MRLRGLWAEVLVTAGFATAPVAVAEIINVPEDFATIQSAISAAADGDEVVIAPGTYFEHISHVGKAITVRGATGTAEDVIIDGAGVGPVVAFLSGEGPDSEIRHVTIRGGYQAGWGGGVMIWQTSPTITGCLITNNTAGNSGGGIAVRSGSNATLVDVEFRLNTAGAGGGGLFVESGATATVTAGRFFGNGGGAISIPGGTVTLTDCRFQGNTTDIGGSAIESTLGSAVTVINCAFWSNTVTGASGSSVSNSPGGMMTLANCTFAGNSGGQVGGLHTCDGSSAVLNCIFWGNGPGQILHDGAGVTTVLYSLVQGGWTGPGAHNIDADPSLLDADLGDLRLSAGSPCIDAANNSALPAGITTDIDGNPRFVEDPETQDTGNGPAPVVDMGAWEFLGTGCLAITGQHLACHADGSTFTYTVEGLNTCTGAMMTLTFTASGGAVGEPMCFDVSIAGDAGLCCEAQLCVAIPDCTDSRVCPADLDGDRVVGIADLLALLGAWGPGGGGPPDFDGDGIVGATDLLHLLSSWGSCL